MNAEFIIELLTLIIGTGGIVALFLITEKKAAAALENVNKSNEEWQMIVAQKEKDLVTLREKYDASTAKIELLYDTSTELRTKLDVANTNFAVCKLMRCDVTQCPNRMPPFGTTEEVKQILDGRDEK